MSALTDFFSQPFWPGVPIGAIAGTAIGALINAKASKASDKRKAEQEDKTNREKREHENAVSALKRSQDEADAAISGSMRKSWAVRHERTMPARPTTCSRPRHLPTPST